MGRAREAGDHVAEAIGLRAMGLAAANLDQVDRAVAYLQEASRIRDLPKDVLLGVLNTYGAVLAWAGESKRGESILTEVIAGTRGATQAQALVQRGAIRFRLSEFGKALSDFDRSESLLEDASSPTWARLHTNRGLTLVMLARLPEAMVSLELGRSAYLQMEAPLAAAAALHNLGWAAGRSGDIPLALVYFDEAEEEVSAVGGGLGELWRDRADLLASAGLTTDALDLATRAVDELEREGHKAAQAEALVRLAETALGHGDLAMARSAATEASSLFRTQQRPGWAAHADLIALRCTFAGGRGGRREMNDASSLARRLHRTLMRDSAVAAEILAARIATRPRRHRLRGRHSPGRRHPLWPPRRQSRRTLGSGRTRTSTRHAIEEPSSGEAGFGRGRSISRSGWLLRSQGPPFLPRDGIGSPRAPTGLERLGTSASALARAHSGGCPSVPTGAASGRWGDEFRSCPAASCRVAVAGWRRSDVPALRRNRSQIEERVRRREMRTEGPIGAVRSRRYPNLSMRSTTDA